MLVGGKDSFDNEIYLEMSEGNKSRTYNNNESQEETDELIKGEVKKEKMICSPLSV
jgi:hypothetical protein